MKAPEHVFMFHKILLNSMSETHTQFMQTCTSAKAHAVLDILLRHMNTANKSSISQNTIAGILQVSRPAVCKLFGILQDANMILRVTEKLGGNSYYLINPYVYFTGKYGQWMKARNLWDTEREARSLAPVPEKEYFEEQEKKAAEAKAAKTETSSLDEQSS